MQVMAGHPTDRKHKDMARKKLPPSFPITTYDITNADYMFGTDLSGARGKAGRKNQEGWKRKNI